MFEQCYQELVYLCCRAMERSFVNLPCLKQSHQLHHRRSLRPPP